MRRIYFLSIWFVLQTTLMKRSVIFFLFIIGFNSYSQTTIKGKVTDKKGVPISFANVFLKNSMDGTTTDTLGLFNFKTQAKDTQVVVVSFVGYQEFSQRIIIIDTIYDLNFK